METTRPYMDRFEAMGWSELADRAARLTPLPARLFLAAIFIWSGTGKISGWEQTAGYMGSRGIPLITFFLIMAILFEIGGGLSILLGIKARLGALALIIFMVPTTLIFHSYWTYPLEEQFMQTIMFMKNLAIIGGLLMVFRFGAGEYSFDGPGNDSS